LSHSRLCEICGKQFKTKASNAKHCSRECRLEARRQRSKARRDPAKTYSKTCLLCGKNFEATNNKTKYCSLDCYKMMGIISKRKKRKTEADELLVDICSVCGVERVPVRECHICSHMYCEKCGKTIGICNICLHKE